MKLYILGLTPSEKGIEFETLTKILLSKKGVSKIDSRVRGSGGLELDVTGEFDSIGFENEKNTKLICECKAYEKEVAITDWLKFIGKVYVEKLRENRSVKGYFIALSGVNGSVRGNYEEIRAKQAEILLVAGSDLLRLMKECFEIANEGHIQKIVSAISPIIILGYNLAYYKGSVYWVLDLPDDRFTILSGTGEILDKEKVELLLRTFPFVEKRNLFHDLVLEFHNSRKMEMADRIVVATLFQTEMDFVDANLVGKFREIQVKSSKEFQFLSEIDLMDAFGRLEENGLIKRVGGKIRMDLSNFDTRCKFLIWMQDILISLILIDTNHYDSLIDLKFLLYLENYSHFRIPENEKEKILLLLRCSPNAIVWGIDFCERYKPNSDQNREEKDLSEIYSRFKEGLISFFVGDFGNKELLNFLLSQRGIHEIALTSTLKIKGKDTIINEIPSETRTMIARIKKDNSLGLVSIYKDLPERWEWSKNKS